MGISGQLLRDIPESFETERLIIRSPLPGDGVELFAAVEESREELARWMPWVDEHTSVEASEESVRRGRAEYLDRTDFRMHLFLKESGSFIGCSGLHRVDRQVPKAEIGYWLRTPETGRGYMTEAVRGITDFASRAFGAVRVEIRCAPENTKSANVAKRCGFALEARLEWNERSAAGELRDTLIFATFPQ